MGWLGGTSVPRPQSSSPSGRVLEVEANEILGQIADAAEAGPKSCQSAANFPRRTTTRTPTRNASMELNRWRNGLLPDLGDGAAHLDDLSVRQPPGNRSILDQRSPAPSRQALG